MKKIPLTQGKEALVDDADYENLAKYNWQAWTPRHAPHLCYAVRKICFPGGRASKVLMHREILGSPAGFEVDHRNGNTLDNRRQNLRLATTSQNQANSRKHVDAIHSRFKGVTWSKCSGRWQASVQCQKRRFYFLSDTEIGAALAYNKKAKELFGEYARINII